MCIWNICTCQKIYRITLSDFFFYNITLILPNEIYLSFVTNMYLLYWTEQAGSNDKKLRCISSLVKQHIEWLSPKSIEFKIYWFYCDLCNFQHQVNTRPVTCEIKLIYIEYPTLTWYLSPLMNLWNDLEDFILPIAILVESLKELESPVAWGLHLERERKLRFASGVNIAWRDRKRERERLRLLLELI